MQSQNVDSYDWLYFQSTNLLQNISLVQNITLRSTMIRNSNDKYVMSNFLTMCTVMYAYTSHPCMHKGLGLPPFFLVSNK